MSMSKIITALNTALMALEPIIPAATISSVTTGSTAIFTTSTPHNLRTGMLVIIADHAGSTPAIDGLYSVVAISATTFSLKNTATKTAIGVTIAGSSGTVLAYLTSFPNSYFEVPIGIPYQQVFYLPARANEPTQGGGFRQDQGIYQVSLIYPLGTGNTVMYQRAELIQAAFAKGESFVADGVTVLMTYTPEIVPAYPGSDGYYMPIKMFYLANIYN